MIELDIEHSQVPSVQPRHEAPSRLRPPQRSWVAGAKKYKYNTKYNTNKYNTKYTPPSGVFSFPGWHMGTCWHTGQASTGRAGTPCTRHHWPHTHTLHKAREHELACDTSLSPTSDALKAGLKAHAGWRWPRGSQRESS
jgi:hypothetical protein